MNKFKDSAGNEWTINITIANFLALRHHDLCDLESVFDDQDFLGGLLDGKDLVAYLGVLHELCKDQYEKNGCENENDFYRLLDSDAMDASVDAFIEAAIAFSPAHRRQAIKESYTTLRMGLEKSGEKAASALKKHRKDLLTKVEKKVEEEIEKLS
tara:strand:- start:1462 stop:1926 length:465 start_codon:yes stop_codon:yes gene_type:complete